MYNAIPMQKRWVYTAASLPHPTGLTFHEKGCTFGAIPVAAACTARGVAQTSEFLRCDLHGFGLDTVVVHPERILHADKTLRDAT